MNARPIAVVARHRLAGLAALLAVLCAAGPSARAAAGPPNVVLILVDDMGFSDLGCYGSEIDTPNLDRLAERGLRLTQFYNTAKCSQTRAALLTGVYHDEVGIMALRHAWTLAEAMKQAGYFTAMTGKWHLNGQPTDRGFDRYFGHLSGATDFFRGDKTFRLNGERFNVPAKGFYTTDANTDYALQFIDESRESEQQRPFFCYVAYNAPHYPLQAPKEDVEKYLGKYMIGWDELRQRRHAKQKRLGVVRDEWELPPRPDDVPAWDSLTDDQKEAQDLRMAIYAAMIDRVDRNVGRLVEHLQELGVLEDTLILFLSDNGGCPFDRNRHLEKMPWEAGSHYTYDKGWAHVCNTPFREYKQNQHEGGISTPLIAHWPNGIRTEPGSLCSETGHLVDVMATLLDLTRTSYPSDSGGQTLKPLRGRSLLPVFRGEQPTAREALYFDFAGRDHAVRLGRWKLVAKGRGPWELYDITADRTELNDLSDEQPARADRLRRMWESWAEEAGVARKSRAGSKSKRAERQESPN